MYEGYVDEVSFLRAKMLNKLTEIEYHQYEIEKAQQAFAELEARLTEIERE